MVILSNESKPEPGVVDSDEIPVERNEDYFFLDKEVTLHYLKTLPNIFVALIVHTYTAIYQNRTTLLRERSEQKKSRQSRILLILLIFLQFVK